VEYALVGVVGAGVMGVGVAQSLVQAGRTVVLVDVQRDILEHAHSEIAKNLRFAAMFDPAMRAVSHSAMLDRIELTTDYERLKTADFVIENATESWAIKRVIYPALDQICAEACIVAANTSAISITRLASLTGREDRVIGMHFMNPVPQKRVVEVIRGAKSSDATTEAARQFLKQMGKDAIVVKDTPGFVSNRVLMLAINEAIAVVEEDIATPADVDRIFVECLAHKMGPLATADLIGLDTVLRSLDVLYESYNDTKYQACALLKRMVASGQYGRKSGQGFFDYTIAGN
jgi:3-hydroxybutyryl-CoA dehydrogenase